MSTAAAPPRRPPEGLHRAVTDWYQANARDLPWRRTRDPYAVLVSEVMLQQTQVERVVPRFAAFIDAFPTLGALAAAPAGDVIRAWAGMGYNARAIRLHQLARVVVAEHGGRLPQTVEGLRRLPGIGPYTAAAVACFAFGASVPMADTNVYRVLSRVVHGARAPSRRVIDALAAELTPSADASVWYQGLMDIGASLCTARPRCTACPLRSLCAAAPALAPGSDREAAEASVPRAPRQPAFRGSRRYYRGRLVDALRALPAGGSLGVASLRRTLGRGPEPSPADGPWLERLIAELERDGLVRVRQGRVALP